MFKILEWAESNPGKAILIYLVGTLAGLFLLAYVLANMLKAVFS